MAVAETLLNGSTNGGGGGGGSTVNQGTPNAGGTAAWPVQEYVGANEVTPSYGLPVAAAQSARTGTTFTSATAVNTAETVSCTGFNTATFFFNQQGTISAGTITFEVNDGTSAWYPIQATQADVAVVNNAYNLQSNTQCLYNLSISPATQVRARLSTAITGSGSLFLGVILSSNANALNSLATATAGSGGNNPTNPGAQLALDSSIQTTITDLAAIINYLANPLLLPTGASTSANQTNGTQIALSNSALPYGATKLTDYTTNGTPLATAATTSMIAAQSGKRIHTWIMVVNSNTTGTEFQILDGSTVIYDGYAAGVAGAGVAIQTPLPVIGSVNTALSIKVLTSGCALYVSTVGAYALAGY